MTHFAAWCIYAYLRTVRAQGQAAEGRPTTLGRDKSACHERRKPLTRLDFSCAGWSVACRKHGFGEQFQWPGMPNACFGLGGCGQ